MLLLALPKAESALHSTLLNGPEWPNVVNEEKGRREMKEGKSLKINAKQKMDGRRRGIRAGERKNY